MGLMGGAAKPGLLLFSHRRRLQIREKERAYQAWRRFATAAEAEHVAAGGSCSSRQSASHGALMAAKREVDAGALATARGHALNIDLHLHDPNLALTTAQLIEKFEQADEEIKRNVDEFP